MLLVSFSIIYISIIPFYLDVYNSSISIFHIMTFGLIFYNSRLFQSQFFNATNQLGLRFIIITSGLLVNFIFLYFVFKNNFSFQLVAWSCSITFIIISSIFMLISLNQIYNNYKNAFILLFKTFLIASINSIIVYKSSIIIDFDFHNFFVIIFNIIIKCFGILIINYFLFAILYINNDFMKKLNSLIRNSLILFKGNRK